MINKDVTLLLKKADELRALFVLGQRVIPFLEEIFIFVSEIQPLLDEINNSIQENLKKMPNASQQLSKVTEATEMATTEIMDIVDGLVYKSDIITANLNRIVEIDAKKRENPIKLLELLHRAIQQKSDLTMILPQLAAAIQNMKNMPGKEYNKIISDTTEIVQSISMDSSSIMMSLQVQDITSQQIAAVNNLLETVQGKLSRILEHFQSSDISDIVSGDELPLDHIKVSKLHREIAFDPDAIDSITNKASRQGEIDDLSLQALHRLAIPHPDDAIPLLAEIAARAPEPFMIEKEQATSAMSHWFALIARARHEMQANNHLKAAQTMLEAWDIFFNMKEKQ